MSSELILALSLVAAVLLLIVVGVRLKRIRDRNIRVWVESYGGRLLEEEVPLRQWRDRRGRRFAVRCEMKPKYWRYLIGEYRRDEIKLIADLSPNEWLDAEEREGQAFVVDGLNVSKVMYEHPARRYINLCIVKMRREGLENLEFRPENFPGLDELEEPSISLEGIIQGLRLAFDFCDDVNSGIAELVVEHNDLSLEWECDPSQPPTWLRLRVVEPMVDQ